MFRTTKINVYIKLMESLGISADRLLAGTRIHSKVLADPEGLITRDMYYDVVMNMIILSRNPAIAFSIQEVFEITDLGILGYAMLSSATLGQVTQIWEKYSNSLIGTLVRIDATRELRSGYELTISSPSLIETFRRFETEEFLVEGMKLIKVLTGISPSIRRIAFSYAKPTYIGIYKKFFDCPMTFGAENTVFSVRSPNRNTPIPTGNAELYKVCAQHCQKVMQSLPDSDPLHTRLGDLFLTRPGNLPDLKVASKCLGMTERRLRSELKFRGASFQALKDEFRFDLSRQLLSSGHMAIKEVSYFLGYSTPSTFCRAFRGWTGKTVLDFVRNEKQFLSSKAIN